MAYWFYTFIMDIIKVDVDIYLCATWLLRTTSAPDIYHLPLELDIYHPALEDINSLPLEQDIYHVAHIIIVTYCHHRLYRTKKLKPICAHASNVQNIVEYGTINDEPQYSKLHEHFEDCKRYSQNTLDIFLFDIHKTTTDSMSTMSGMRVLCRVSGIRMYSRYLYCVRQDCCWFRQLVWQGVFGLNAESRMRAHSCLIHRSSMSLGILFAAKVRKAITLVSLLSSYPIQLYNYILCPSCNISNLL